MVTPASRLLLNNAQVSIRLIRGSSSIRAVLGSFEDHRSTAPTQVLGHLHFQEPPQVDLDALRGTRESVSLLRAGMNQPLFDTETGRSYCRGRREAEISEGESVEISDEVCDDDDEVEDFYSEDEGDYDSDELMHESDEEDEKLRKRN